MKNIDQPYLDSILEVTKQLGASYSAYSSYKFDLSKSEITEAVISRLKAYYTAQNEIKQQLKKRYAAPASDFFVETILFFTKVYLQQYAPHLDVISEKEILLYSYRNEEGKIRREVIRPDITIKNGDDVFAIIECKTQLGRSRSSWQEDYEKRKGKLESKFPSAKMFLIVMTEDNWGGFGNDSRVGVEFFALLKSGCWPMNYNDKSQIRTKIEDLLKQLGLSLSTALIRF